MALWRIVLDESQCIKAENTAQTRAVLALPGRTFWCATGTPFGTELLDIAPQLRFLRFPATRAMIKRLTAHPLALEDCLARLMIRHVKQKEFRGHNLLSLSDRTYHTIEYAPSPPPWPLLLALSSVVSFSSYRIALLLTHPRAG
jgi:SNF2 domain-containing protein